MKNFKSFCESEEKPKQRTWVSTAPHHVQSEYKHGKCFDLALHLHQKHKLPLYGLYDKTGGGPHHAFVKDGEHGVDIRGSMPLDQIAKGSKAEGGTVRQITKQHINDALKPFFVDDADIRKAGRIASKYLKRQ